MTLYEISREYSDFVIAVENGEIPEEAINDTFEMLTGELDEKIDNTACVIKNLNAEAAAIKGEIDALAARKKSKENLVAYLKNKIAQAMQSSGKIKLETPRNALSFRRSESVEISDEAAFVAQHPEYVAYSPKIDKTEVKKAIKAGETIDGAALIEKQNLQIK